MRKISITVSFFLLLNVLFCTLCSAADQRDAVVKVFVTSNSMDFYQPWQSRGNQSSTGSGCVISGNRILTNAHVVTDQTFIQVRKHSNPKKYTAQLIAIAHDCDLALLSVDDESFFDGVVPFELGGLPKLQDTVNVIGYPTGGDKLSITEGVVSRVEVRPYAHSMTNLLTVQIDAAINPGNSGGPVIQNGKLVGIAMQVANKTQNIGYIIPVPIIAHFFKDLDDAAYDGFPVLGVDLDNTENPTLREFYRIKNEDGGVLVANTTPFSPADGLIKEGDVILEIDNVAIGEDGTFSFRDTERLFMSHIITQKQIGESLKIAVMRKGEKKMLTAQLHPHTYLVPQAYYYKKPTYYIYGGFVFSVLSMDLVRAWGKNIMKAPFDFNYFWLGEGRLNRERRKQVVVLLRVLPSEINVGYHGYKNEVITKINGHDIDSFKDFIGFLQNQKQAYTIIETAQKSQIIIDHADALAETDQILARYDISAQHSSDIGNAHSR